MAQHRHDNRQADNGGVVPLRVFPQNGENLECQVPVGFERAVEVGRTVLTHAEAGSKGGGGNKASDNVPGFERGNSADYTLGRLMRDNPELRSVGIHRELMTAAAR